MQHDIEGLLDQLPPLKREARATDLHGFSRLFERFLNETGPSIDWEKIERLPEGSVSTARALQ